MKSNDVEVGAVYTHFKGGLYVVRGVAKNSETLEDMVVYESMEHEGGLWVRPYAMFGEEIERDGKKVKRFTKK